MELFIYLTFLSVLQLNGHNVLGIRISQKKCKDYRNRVSPPVKVFNDNDEEAAPKEFPFMATIYDDGYWNGILISENCVLSTALPATNVFGDLDVSTINDDARIQRLDIIEEFTHSKYNADDRTCNIRLLKLNESITFDEYVRPACLSQPESEIEQKLLQIGWSATNIRSNYLLHKLPLNYVSDRNCTETYRAIAKTKYVRDIDSGQIFCAGVKAGGKKICKGFSGSALLNRRLGSMDEVMGIASFSLACNNSYPTIFLRVASYIDWIEGIVWPNETVTDILHTETTLMLHTTNKITTEASTTQKIASKTEEPTTQTVKITTKASTTSKIESKTEDAEPSTQKVKITTEASTTPKIEPKTEEPTTPKVKIEIASSTTSHSPPREATKAMELKNIIIIVAVLLLVLCVDKVNKWRNSQNVSVNVHYTARG